MNLYIIDTSSLIELKNTYPQDIFPTLWEKIDELIKQKRLIAPSEVQKEIEQGDDELNKWAKDRQQMFIDFTEIQFKKIKEILKKYPNLAKEDKTQPNADPWIIALALEYSERKTLWQKKIYIITEESKTKNNKIPTIAKVLSNNQIESLNLIELFRIEKWSF